MLRFGRTYAYRRFVAGLQTQSLVNTRVLKRSEVRSRAILWCTRPNATCIIAHCVSPIFNKMQTAKPIRKLQFPQWFGCNCNAEFYFLLVIFVYFSRIVCCVTQEVNISASAPKTATIARMKECYFLRPVADYSSSREM